MNVASRIVKSVYDGSFLVKALNRVSQVATALTTFEVDRHISENCRGDDWKKLSPAAREARLWFFQLFDMYIINTIVYVGANNGRSALAINEAFPGKEFFLLEPVPQTFNLLVSNTSTYSNMHCFNVAAGSNKGSFEMFVDEFSPASSLLAYKPVAVEEYPFLGKHSIANVRVQRLDDITSGIQSVDMIIMDVQGYEDEVLKGARESLRSCQIVMSELSLQTLYDNSSTFDSVYQTLIKEGFRLFNLVNPMRGKSGRVLQIDGVFVRE